MNKKTYLWLVIVLIIVVAAIYLLASSSDNVSPVKTGVPVANDVNGANNVKVASTSDGTTLPAGLTPIPTPATDASFSKETIIKVDGSSFTPKTIEAKAKTKVFLTLSATDDKRHTFGFTDPSLDFILVVFNKAEGNKSITFPAPKAGSYSFYIDDKANTGTLVIK